MLRISKIVGFLTINSNWDPSLMFVMVGALGVNFITFTNILKKDKPVYQPKFDLPTNSNIDVKLVIGAMIFGLGWGLSGLCPGPAMVDLFNLSYIWIFIMGLISG